MNYKMTFLRVIIYIVLFIVFMYIAGMILLIRAFTEPNIPPPQKPTKSNLAVKKSPVNIAEIDMNDPPGGKFGEHYMLSKKKYTVKSDSKPDVKPEPSPTPNAPSESAFSKDRPYEKPSRKEKTLVYDNTDSITFRDAWSGNIKAGTVFYPGQPFWYFEISGVSEDGAVIFSTSWHYDILLQGTIPPYEEIKMWQVTVAAREDSPPMDGLLTKLKVE